MPAAFQAYLSPLPPERKAVLAQLHRLILSLYPDAEITMQYRMPTYRAGEGWVAIANQKHYVSLYTCGACHIAEFRKKHPQIRTGKGCINFKPGDILPETEIKQVVSHAMETPKGGQAQPG